MLIAPISLDKDLRVVKELRSTSTVEDDTLHDLLRPFRS